MCNTDRYLQKELVSLLNSACKHADSHFYFDYRPEAGGKIGVWLNCAPACHLTHHMALSNKLQRILGCATETFDKSISLVTLTLRKSASDRILYTEIFYRAGFISEKTHNVGFFASEPASLLRGIPDKMFVYCDLCESYVTGDVRSPLLRIVPIEAHTDIFAYGATLIAQKISVMLQRRFNVSIVYHHICNVSEIIFFETLQLQYFCNHLN